MASSSQLPDNMMNYFMFKAKQRLLLEKENQEWKNFCEQVAPECAACIAEKINTNKKKDVGIQALPKQPVRVPVLQKPSAQTKSQNGHDREILVNLLARLEKIDITLSKLCSESSENEKEKEFNIQRKSYPPISPAFSNEQFLKVYEEQRKQLIQNSLRASLQKSASSQSIMHKKPTAIKQNPSFLLPHDLQVKRAAARRAYLSSLQTKPKVSFKNINKKNDQSSKASRERPNAPTNRMPVSKPRKKVAKRKTEKLDEDKVETLINEAVNNDAEDESTAFHPQTSSLEKSSFPNVVEKGSERSDTEFKLSIDSNEKMQREEPREGFVNETITNLYAKAMEVPKGPFTAKKNSVPTSEIKTCEIRNPPKFECDIKHVISIDPERAKNISHHKETFWRYLESISRTVKGNFNPWILNEVLAETILDECISDVVEELEELPSIFAQDIYIQEFAQVGN